MLRAQTGLVRGPCECPAVARERTADVSVVPEAGLITCGTGKPAHHLMFDHPSLSGQGLDAGGAD